MTCSINSLKWCVYIYSIIYVFFAMVSTIFHIYMIFTSSEYAGARVFCIGFNALGVVSAFLGCYGALKESRCEVKTFAVFQVIFLIIHVICAIALFQYTNSGLGLLHLLAAIFTMSGVIAGFSLDRSISNNHQTGYIYDRNNEVILASTPQQNR